MESFDLVLCALGIACCLAPVELRRDRRRLRARSGRTVGVVIDHVQRTPHHDLDGAVRHGPATRHARILYEVDGREHECTSSVGASWIVHAVGSAVDVRFDPARPDDADIVSPLNDRLLDGLMIGFPVTGAGMLVLGIARLMG